ncbi:MAG: hypothetical protein GVY28_02630, partial [Alphaproteobacteria bacterium]|nr:hypothetical protein [Alphaproteobacteria bacterium]
AADLRALADAGMAPDRAALGGVFPDGCNLQIARVVPGANRIVLRTWERGGGPTAASGSSSSAAAVAAYARGLVGPRVAVEMPGGTLTLALDGPPTAIAGIALESPVIRIAEMTVATEGLTVP